MDKYIYDESNGLWYELQGEYYLPCLTLPPEEEKPIGVSDSGTCGICGSTAKLHTSIFSQAAGLMATLQR